MSRLLEHDGKALLALAGVQVPQGHVADGADAAERFARELGGDVVVKALVAANRRAKSGFVLFAATPDEARRRADQLLAATFMGEPIAEVLVEEKIRIDHELYFSLSVDRDRGTVVALASLEGGVDVEETVGKLPDVVRRLDLDSFVYPQAHLFRRLWSSIGLSGPALARVADVCARAARVFFEVDATVLEINPLAVSQSGEDCYVTAVGALIGLDDNARGRDRALHDRARPDPGWRALTPRELAAREAAAFEPHRGTARFIELEGDIALLMGGGGGSQAIFEAVRRAGGAPACFTEIGGNPSAEKVKRLTRVVLTCPGVRGLLVAHNITNNTQVDLVAAGVIEALEELALDPRSFPVLAREVGTNDELGRRIFEGAGVEYLGEGVSLEEAAGRVVGRVATAREQAPG